MKNKVYKIITDRFIDALEKGEIPWEKPWNSAGMMPANGSTGRQYSGVNTLLLGMMPYEQPYWLTFNQAKKAGGNVIKGEKSTPVIFWKINSYDKETGDKLSDKKARKWKKDPAKKSRVKTVPILRYYNVFNVEQCENLDPDSIERVELKSHEWSPMQQAEKIVQGMPNAPKIENNGGGRAFYRPSSDEIQMPARERFDCPAKYYSVLFHEMAHSTGHSSRLDRDLSTGMMDKKSYSKEELIAEITSAFLNNEAGILEKEFDNSAAYIAGWLKVFRNEDNENLIVNAAANAQHAADYILNRK